MNTQQCCSNCSAETRVRHRDFSEQVWSILLMWGEISEESVDQLFCDDCYRDLREVLIERSAEMDAIMRSGNLSLKDTIESRRKEVADGSGQKHGKAAEGKPSLDKAIKGGPAKKGRSKIAS